MDPPTHQRNIHFDQERIDDLSLIQSDIVEYWKNKGVPPETLGELKENNISFDDIPTDPKTHENYSYILESPLSFTLCATFNTEQSNTRGQYFSQGISTNWDHSIGKTCFNRTIDPDFFKPALKQ